MIPYFEIPPLGPLKPFGVLVATGILVGSWFAQRRARQAKINLDEVRSAVAWAVVVGFIGAHLVALVYYKPERIGDEGVLVILKIWDGISSFGGFIGALAGLFIFYGRLSRPRSVQATVLLLPFVTAWLSSVNILVGQIAFGISVAAIFVYYRKPDKPWSGVAEIIVQALVVGWVFGRAGCTVAFDHPGVITDFFLAEQYGPDGPVRHNLGFYEFLYTLLVMLPVILILHRKNPPMGLINGVVAVLYAPARFLFDFLRAANIATADARFMGLTPAQYMSIALFVFGIWQLYRIGRGVKTDPDYPRVWDLSDVLKSTPVPEQSRPSKAGARTASPSGSSKSGSAKKQKAKKRAR